MKYYLILFLSLLFSSQLIETGVEDKSMVYIYHSGKAMINENRYLNINKNGFLNLDIADIPIDIIDSGIQIESDNFNLNTYSVIRDLITEKKLIEYFLGSKIILRDEKYNKNIDATILSFSNGNVIYGIENGVIANPNLKPVFPYIPEKFKDKIYIKAYGNGNLGSSTLDLSYFVENMNWITEYHLVIENDDIATLNANYQIQNRTNKSYLLSEIFLVADKNIKKRSNDNRFTAKLTKVANSNNFHDQPNALDIDDVSVFKVPGKITLDKHSNINCLFIPSTQLKYDKQYIASHEVKYYDYSRREQNLNSLSPTDVFIKLKSKEIIKSDLPEGKMNIYKIDNDNKIFIGEKFLSKNSKDIPLSFQFKKSNDILHSFNQISFDEHKDGYQIKIQATFKNLLDKKSEVLWVEKTNQPSEILSSSIEFNKRNIFEHVAIVNLNSGQTKNEYIELYIPKIK